MKEPIDYIRMAHARRLAAYVTAKRDLCDAGQLVGEMVGLEFAASLLDFNVGDDLSAARIIAVDVAFDLLLKRTTRLPAETAAERHQCAADAARESAAETRLLGGAA